MKITTRTLEGEALNYAVASIEELDLGVNDTVPDYAGDWGLSGPILEKAGISLSYLSLAEPPMWAARRQPTVTQLKPVNVYAQSALVAGLRALVEEHYGHEVQIPEEVLLRQITTD